MLGKYFIPTDETLAGKITSITPGDGENGLQPDFVAAVRSFVNHISSEYKGYKIDLGSSGYVARITAEQWSESGNPKFLQYIKYFGWGIAWEFTVPDTASKTAALSSISTIAKEYGLSVNLHDNGGFTFLTPLLVQSKSGISVLEYGGDATSSEEAAAQTEAAATNATGSLASTAWFFASSFGDVMNDFSSYVLTGERAIANDEPVWDTIKSIFNSSMRTIMAGPDGSFIAWYPDYWGVAGNTPCLLLDDIELIDVSIDISDQTFYTHQFSAGVNVGGTYLTSDGRASDMQWALTQGVVSIESNMAAQASSAASKDEFYVSDEVSHVLSKMVNIPESEKWRFTPKELYRRYGARPNKKNLQHVIEDPNELDENSNSTLAANPKYILPFLYAVYEFMRNWAHQRMISISFGYMPQIERGMRIKVKSLGLSGYVEGVSHRGGAGSSGYFTTVTLSCPSCEAGDPRFPGMVSWEPGVVSSKANDETKEILDLADNLADSVIGGIKDSVTNAVDSVIQR